MRRAGPRFGAPPRASARRSSPQRRFIISLQLRACPSRPAETHRAALAPARASHPTAACITSPAPARTACAAPRRPQPAAQRRPQPTAVDRSQLAALPARLPQPAARRGSPQLPQRSTGCRPQPRAGRISPRCTGPRLPAGRAPAPARPSPQRNICPSQQQHAETRPPARAALLLLQCSSRGSRSQGSTARSSTSVLATRDAAYRWRCTGAARATLAAANPAFKTNQLARLVLKRHSPCCSETARPAVAQSVWQRHSQCCSGAAVAAVAQPVLRWYSPCCSGAAPI